MGAKERLIEFLVYLEIGQNAFEKKTGISNGYISHIKNSIGSNIIKKISEVYPELDTNWLLTGNGSMLKKYDAIQGLFAGLRPEKKVSETIIDYKEKSEKLQAENYTLLQELRELSKENRVLSQRCIQLLEDKKISGMGAGDVAFVDAK